MKLHITITGSSPFEIEADKDMTVDELKKMLIEDEHFPKGCTGETIKIISFGKFLDDGSKKLSECNINANGRLIVYIPKKPNPPAPKPEESKPEEPKPQPTESISPTSDEQIDPPAQSDSPMAVDQPVSPPSAASTSQPQSQSQPQAQAQPALPQVDAEKLQQLLMMGFEEDNSRKALAAASGNINLAVDYLLSGNIPEVPARPAAAPAGVPRFGAGLGAGAGAGININELLAYIQQSDPETYAQIRANPQMLIQFLQQMGISPEALLGAALGNQMGVPAPAAAPAAPGAPANGALSVSLSAAEEQQVEMICSMTGLPHDSVKVVYVRLGRNPDAACDIIFEYGDRFRGLSPAEIDAMFAQMQRAARLAHGNNGAGAANPQYRYDSDDDDDDNDSNGSDGSDDGDGGDDDFYL